MGEWVSGSVGECPHPGPLPEGEGVNFRNHVNNYTVTKLQCQPGYSHYSLPIVNRESRIVNYNLIPSLDTRYLVLDTNVVKRDS